MQSVQCVECLSKITQRIRQGCERFLFLFLVMHGMLRSIVCCALSVSDCRFVRMD